MSALLNILAVSATLGSAQSDGPLTVEKLYHGADQAIMVHVASDDAGLRQLALMDANGRLYGTPVNVRPGRRDLVELFEPLRDGRETMYVQLISDGEPVGAALVIQPLLTPLRPRTEPHVESSTGEITTRIAAWDEPDPRVFSGYRVYPEEDVVLSTSEGDVRVMMRADHAPNTVWNFLSLVRGGFYDGVTFHRIVPLTGDGDPFVIQGGDPSGTGLGGPGFNLALEPSALQHDFGVISMARAEEPDSGGSQFFICLSREGTARLDGQYASFGYAISGAEVITAIADVELTDVTAGKPADPPVVHSARLVPATPRQIDLGRIESRVRPEQDEPELDESPPGRIPR